MITYVVQIIRLYPRPMEEWVKAAEPNTFNSLDKAIERMRNFRRVPTISEVIKWEQRVVRVTEEVVA